MTEKIFDPLATRSFQHLGTHSAGRYTAGLTLFGRPTWHYRSSARFARLPRVTPRGSLHRSTESCRALAPPRLVPRTATQPAGPSRAGTRPCTSTASDARTAPARHSLSTQQGSRVLREVVRITEMRSEIWRYLRSRCAGGHARTNPVAKFAREVPEPSDTHWREDRRRLEAR